MSQSPLQQSVDTQQFPAPWLGHRYAGKYHLTKSKVKMQSINPNNGKTLMEGDPFAEIESLLLTCHQALPSLRDLAGTERFTLLAQFHAWLQTHETSLTRCVAIETGRPLWDVKLEYQAAKKHLGKVVGLGHDFDSYLLRMGKVSLERGDFIINPLGVTIAYLPFSNPIYSMVSFLTAAIIAKCPLILFSSSHTLMTSSLFSMIDSDLNLPRGLFSLIFGSFDDFRKILSDNRIAAVIYHGSREHCQTLLKEKKYAMRQLLLHSGGKNSVIVHSSGDLDLAVKSVLFGAFRSAGQQSSTTSRVFVYRSMLQPFKERFIQALRELAIGRTDVFANVQDEGPFMGPLYSHKASEKFLRFQTMAGREAKDSWQWGKRLDIADGGNFVCPGVHFLENFDDTTSYQSNILFCPDLAIYAYDVLDDAIRQVNQTDSPYVVSFIGDPQHFVPRRSQFVAPNLVVNLPTSDLEEYHPLVGGFTRQSHRFQDLALSLYLTRPQSLLQPRDTNEFMSLFHRVHHPIE